MKTQKNTEAEEADPTIGNPEYVPSTDRCVSYHSLPLESDETFDALAFTFKFHDGRNVTTAIAKDGRNHGMWFKITKPLENGKESELKFRLSLEAAAVLSQLIDYALEHPRNLQPTQPKAE